ncbi:MAG: hypothetical protein P8Y92_06415 [Halioglobus sp.]
MTLNQAKLRAAEASFLQRYPGGFSDPGMDAVKKKHNVDRLVGFTRENLSRAHFNQPERVTETLLKVVSRSSMVSRFEKPRFRDFIGSLNGNEKRDLADALEQRLHGRKQQGFDRIIGMLQPYRLARWAVVSIVPFYYAPNREVFVKPTTAKGIIAYLEVDDLHYSPTPSWEFYRGYRDLIAEVRRNVIPTLAPNNAALTGFLMASL